ncbi:MAG: 50S ribosomal protein L10 [Chloroflexi bacterium]|nr:50S ribosomal protein L10 [Chloroflexota bacterium]
MAITKQRRHELVALYGEIISKSDGFVITEFNRLPTAKINDLRARLRGIDGKFVITKNTLFGLALKNAGWPVPEQLLKGSVAVSYGTGNFPAIAKETLAFIKDNSEQLQVKGGIMIASILRANDVEMLSTLPGLDEMRAQLAGLIVTPASALLGVIDAATGQVVNVLHAYVEERGGQSAA